MAVATRASDVADTAPRTSARPRLARVDALRGLVMIVMALDHVRDFFSGAHVSATDVAHTTVPLFLTRWVTHYCAPVFVLLAGTSAYLWRARGRTTAELSRFLWTRGLWLVVLEVTVVRLGWFFNFDYHLVVLQVIWAIGASMVILAALVRLPTAAVVAFGVILIAGHDLTDGIPPERFGALAWAWCVLHVPRLPIAYPLVPWVGVMALGYGLGGILRRERVLVALGLAMTVAFVVVRGIDAYGDPSPWSVQPTATFTALSFLAVSKYPPSLDYVLMTIGPALLLLPALERVPRGVRDAVATYGRVPLFFYVLHIYLIHALAVGAAWATGHDPARYLTIAFMFPPDWGFGLPTVYATWVLVVVLLYPPSRWFAGVKQRRSDPWLSYL